MKKLILLSILLSQLVAVGDYLLIPPNGYNNSLGGTGVSSPSIYQPFYNPAAPLNNKELSIGLSTGYGSWLPNLATDLYKTDTYLSIVYTRNINNRLSVQINYTNINFILDFGEQLVIDELGTLTPITTSISNYKGNSFSVGLKSFISNNSSIFFSYGYTNKHMVDEISIFNLYEYEQDIRDYGYLLSLNNKIKGDYTLTSTFGYSKSNVTNDYSWHNDYNDYDHRDPFPRNAKVGISFMLEKTLKNGKYLSATILREAEDLLLERNYSEEEGCGIPCYIYLDSDFGDIEILDNVILSNSDDSTGITIHRGLNLNYNNVINFGFGKLIDKEGRIDIKTWGFNLSILNIIKYKNLNDYLELNWIFSYDGGEQGNPRANTMHHQLQLKVNNIDKLLFN